MFLGIPFSKSKRSSYEKRNGHYRKLKDDLQSVDSINGKMSKRHTIDFVQCPEPKKFYVCNSTLNEKRFSTQTYASTNSVNTYDTSSSSNSSLNDFPEFYSKDYTTTTTTNYNYDKNENYRRNTINGYPQTFNSYYEESIDSNNNSNKENWANNEKSQKKKNRKRKTLSKILQSFSVSDQYLEASMKCPDWEYYCQKEYKNYNY